MEFGWLVYTDRSQQEWIYVLKSELDWNDGSIVMQVRPGDRVFADRDVINWMHSRL